MVVRLFPPLGIFGCSRLTSINNLENSVKHQTLIRTATIALVIAVSLTSHSEAQRNNWNQRFLGNANSNIRGGLPNFDSVPNRNSQRHRIRNNRILSNGQLQWEPQQAIQRITNAQQNLVRPPQPSPYAAGPTVGGRFRFANRPRPQHVQPQHVPRQTGWQPWMHVPMDGSQPWNR